MEIPPTLEKVLATDPKLHGSVEISFEEFHPWLEKSGTPFFPEYTDHGPEHINDVLRTAQSIISDDAWRVVTPDDVAALVLSTLLHDAPMHLTEDGFVNLISDKQERIVPGLSDRPWQPLWESFLSEARRFNERKLRDIFGDTEPVHQVVLRPQDMSERDRKLIGAFLRLHHHRLAHEIALFGVPGPQTEKLRLKEVPDYLADISGLIARSHGLPVRSCVEYLQSKYDLREYRGIHSVFLMTLLRLSDYLQVQEERAPKQLIGSPSSKPSVSTGVDGTSRDS